MIITRTPLRITLGGGGSDLPEFYEKHGGFCIAAAINKYVYVAVNKNFDPTILLKYSQTEQVTDPNDIQHPLLRECLSEMGVTEGIEITSMADIPAGTGLGSSGAFTVGVLRALSHYRRQAIRSEELANRATFIDGLGKQDPWISAIGGLSAIRISADGHVIAHRIDVSDEIIGRLESNLVLFYTGKRREAKPEVASHKAVEVGTMSAGQNAYQMIISGELDAFGIYLTHQWELKHNRSQSDFHEQCDAWIGMGMDAGALGGKLIGAGGGGFLLFYTDAPKDRLVHVLKKEGLVEVPFSFDELGSTTICG